MAKKAKPHRAKGPFDYKRQMRFDFEYAKRCLMEDGYVQPVFVVHAKTQMIPIGVNRGYNDEEKQKHQTVAALLACANDAVAVSFIGEAWAASAKPDEPDPECPVVRPSDREDRIEVIIATLIWRDAAGERWTAAIQAEIVRNDKGEPSGVTNELLVEPTDQIGGNFGDLLTPNPPSPQLREAAQTILDRLSETGALQNVAVSATN